MDNSPEQVRKIGGGRLKRQSSEDHISISSDLDLQPLEDLIKKPIKQKKPKKSKKPKTDEMSDEKSQKAKAPRRKTKKQTEGEEEQAIPKQPKKLKKVVESNDAIMERLKNNPLFQGEEDEPKPRDQESSIASIRTDEEDAPKRKKGGGKKQNGISMRHKFFKSFDDELPPTEEPVNIISLDDQDIYDERLVFQQENPLPRDDVQKKMNDQVQQYKNKIAVFDGEQPQPQPKKQQDLLRRMQSMPTEVEYQPDELEINLIMPTLGSRDAVIDGTLYVNKMKNKLNFQSRTTSQVNLSNSKSYSRGEFLKRMNQKINERGGRNISMDSLLNKFQKTELVQIVQDKEKKKQQKLGDIDENKNNEDESSPDEEFKPEDVKDDTGEDSRKALEDSQNDIELVKNSGDEIDIENEDNKSEHSQQSKSSHKSDQSHYTINSLSQSQQQSNHQQSVLPSTLEDVPKTRLMVVNSGESEQEEEIDEEELKMFTRLRKISQTKRLKKLKEQERLRQREIKRKEMEELRKKVSANFIEEEAELGSDDENHDDVVKPKENDKDDDEQDDQFLEGLIDDELAEINEDNEERAYRMYLQRQNKEEKEQLRKILRGEFKVGNKDRDAMFLDALNIHNSEAARLARMEECMKRLQSKDAAYDEIDEDDEIESAIKNPLLDKSDLKQQIREERLYHDQMKIRNFIQQNNQEKLDQELVGLLGNRALQRIAQKQQTAAATITTKPQSKPIYGLVPQKLNFGHLSTQPQAKTFNSFLNRTLQDQNKPENNHSNSMSQMRKNKPSTYPLNKLFASCVQNGNMGTKIQKSPNKLLIFGQRKK